MKKLILTIIIVAFVLLGGTYFIGEILQKKLPKVVAQQYSADMNMDLLSYEKSFFTAKSKIKLSLRLEGEEPLQFLIESDISHYPYKATAINHITLIDSETADIVTHFFHEKDWITSDLEVNFLGNLSGEIKLTSGSFESKNERLTTQPLNLSYEHDLINNSSELNLEWLGFNGKTSDGEFSAESIEGTYHFSHVKDVPLLNYQYQAVINNIELKKNKKKLSAQGILLKGNNKISDDLLTLKTSNDWKVKKYLNGTQSFTDNHINLQLSDINLNALTIKKTGGKDSDVPKQIFSNLLQQGFHIDLQNLYSVTPWGKVDGKLTMDIQPGMTLAEMVKNPFLLIDYVNGNVDLSLPQKLSQQPELGDFLKMGTMTGVLKPEGEQLTVKSTLDRGQLTVNERIIPM